MQDYEKPVVAYFRCKGKICPAGYLPKYSRLLYLAMTPTGMWNKHLKLNLSLTRPLILKHTNNSKAISKTSTTPYVMSSKYFQNSSFLILHRHPDASHYHLLPGLLK